MNVSHLESELKKRLAFPYNWGRKQSDDWDFKTKFIYQTKDFESLENQCKDFDEGLRNYAFNRWLNFWSAKAVEAIFASSSLVKKEENQFSKYLKIPNLNERQAQILFWVEENPNRFFTVKEIQNIFNITNQTARTDIEDLVDLNYLKKVSINKKSFNYWKGEAFDKSYL